MRSFTLPKGKPTTPVPGPRVEVYESGEIILTAAQRLTLRELENTAEWLADICTQLRAEQKAGVPHIPVSKELPAVDPLRGGELT